MGGNGNLGVLACSSARLTFSEDGCHCPHGGILAVRYSGLQRKAGKILGLTVKREPGYKNETSHLLLIRLCLCFLLRKIQ